MPSSKSRQAVAAPAATLTWDNVLAWRMARQHLRQRLSSKRALDVTADLCGLHAQVMSSAELTLAARVDGLAPDAVQGMLWQDRTLVKTWAMRGTLHLLPASELPLWCAAQSIAPPRYHTPSWQKWFGVTRAEMEAAIAVVPSVLDGKMLTREALATALATETGLPHLAEALTGSWGTVLKPLAFVGALCFAPNDGRNVRFTHPGRWLGGWQPVDPETAIAAVIRRYLHTYGPATTQEVSRWLGSLSVAQLGRRIKQLGEDVTEVEVDGTRAWALAADVPAMAEMGPTGDLRLLPAFDQYVVTAPRDQDAVLPSPLRGRVYRPQGWFSPVVVEDGRIIGTWRYERAGATIAVTVEPFGRLSAGQREGVAAEADRLTRHLGGSLALTIAAPA